MKFPQQKKWVWKTEHKVEIPPGFGTSLSLSPLVMETLLQRGINTDAEAQAFIDYRAYTPASPFDLPDMEKGIERTIKAISNKEMIGVWGDFDVDGQTSTTVLVSTLRRLNANVVYHIPVRGPESHGIQLEKLKEFLGQGVTLLITCDTGISAHTSIDYAQSKGVDVIITDHHILPDELPKALAVINPQRLESMHKLRPLPGVGTAYKFAEALLAHYGENEFINQLHDLAAMGIVADVAELRGEARYLVQSGLENMRTCCRPALQRMLDVAEVNPSTITEEQISFTLAPRLNAVGRLADANPLVEFFLSDDPSLLAVTVNQLEGLNARRKLLCDQVFQGALAQIEREPGLLDQPVLLLHHPEWPASVVGITASRLVEMFQMPVILMVGAEGGIYKGSARSLEGVDITWAISQQQEYLQGFGGHPMAAGLSLNADKFKAFQRGLNNTVSEILQKTPLSQEVVIDSVVQPSSVSFETIREIEKLAPFGAGNPALLFGAQKMKLVDSIAVGKTRDHLQMLVEDQQGNVAKLIWWQGSGLPQPEGLFNLAYTARATTYKGQPQIQLEWVDFQSEEEPASISTRKRASFEIHDFRTSKSPKQELQKIADQNSITIWKEGTDGFSVNSVRRKEIEKTPTVVIWTIPPDASVLSEVVKNASPKTLYLFANQPEEGDPGILLRKIAKQIKQNLNMGQTSISPSQMASTFVTTNAVILRTIHWLAAKGDINIIDEEKDTVILELGGVLDEIQEKLEREKLQKILKEIQAYRNFYLTAEASNLLDDVKP